MYSMAANVLIFDWAYSSAFFDVLCLLAIQKIPVYTESHCKASSRPRALRPMPVVDHLAGDVVS